MRTMHRRKLCFYYLIMASCAVTLFFAALSCVISMDHNHHHQHGGDHYHRIQSADGESMPSSNIDSLPASALQQGQLSFPSISRYCSIQVPAQHGIDKVQAQHLSLIHVAIAIRHGDRSSIHSIPNSSTPVRLDHSNLRNNRTLLLLNDTALSYSPHLRHFELKRMASIAETDGALKGEDLSLSLDPSTAFRESDYSLSPGQLTSRGFMQHIQLGQLLRSQYGAPLLDHIRSPQQLYVRSTNYIRTIRSVSALLTALLPQVTAFKRKVGISYFENEMDECMHGIGEHGSSHSVKSHNSTLGSGIHQETVATGTCARAVSLSRRQRQSFSADERVTQRVTSLFGRVQKSIPELLDASLPNLCHQLPLPCSSDTSQCLQEEDVQLMLAESDRYYCDRFAGIHGGLNSTRLAMYPFMKEIADHLVRAAVHDRDDDDRSDAAEKLSVFSGHDTVIAPVLAALGVYNGALCYWPPYASRIVFELYRQHSPPNDSTVEAGEWTRASTGLRQLYPPSESTNSAVEPAAFSPQQQSFYSRAFVRILFNGEDITEGVPACSYEGPSHPPPPSPSVHGELTGGRMCPLDRYLRQVHSLLAPHRGLDLACQIRS